MIDYKNITIFQYSPEVRFYNSELLNLKLRTALSSSKITFD